MVNIFKEDKYMMDGVGAYSKGYDYSSKVSEKTNEETQTGKTKESDKVAVTGRTYGNAKLSKKAAEYYKELKKKYGNMDFVLVDKDKIDEAKQNMAQFGSTKGLTVLVDTEKIERMAEDEDFRKKYETILDNAQNQLPSMLEKLSGQYGSAAGQIKSIGMTVDDKGNAQYFAVIDKSLKAQKERIESKREQKAEEAKEAAKKEKAERLEKQQEARKAESKNTQSSKSDYEIVESDSLEGLFDKLSKYLYDNMADNVMTDSEKKLGQSFDYTV